MKFECPSCSQRLEANEEQVGKVFDCPSCSAEVVVPRLQSLGPPPLPSMDRTKSLTVVGAPPLLPDSERVKIDRLKGEDSIDAGFQEMKAGIYFGDCRNTTFGIEAKIALLIERVEGNAVFGTLGIYGDLMGGSSFRGQLFGREFEFQTIDPPFSIIWKASFAGGVLDGNYVSTTNGLFYRLLAKSEQVGIWNCKLAQSTTHSILSAADSSSVVIRSSGIEEGPLAFPYFSDLLLQDKWERDSEFQIKGTDEWVPVGLLQDAILEAMPDEAQEESLMKGVGSEATRKILGRVIASAALAILGLE